MSVTNKQPGKFWHFAQGIKLSYAAWGQPKEKPVVKSMARSALYSVAALGAGVVAWNLFPFFIVWAPAILASGAVTVYQAKKTSQDFSMLKRSRFGENFLREKLNAWKALQAKGTFGQRLKVSVLKFINRTGKFLGGTVLAASATVGTLAGLQWAGVGTGALASVTTTATQIVTGFGIGAVAAIPVVVGVAAAGAIIGGVTLLRSYRALKALNDTGSKSATTPKGKVPSWIAKAYEPPSGADNAFNKNAVPKVKSDNDSAPKAARKKYPGV